VSSNLTAPTIDLFGVDRKVLVDSSSDRPAITPRMTQSSEHAKPDSVDSVYSLPTILEPLVLAQLFPRTQPLEVELGSGDGSFLSDYAKAHPETNFLGIERLLGRIRKMSRKTRRAGLANLRGIRIESAYFLEYLLPRHSASALHIYFPDPWPKRKHRRHRLINERFPELARKALVPEGQVFLRTDDSDYFRQMIEVFERSPKFRQVATPSELSCWLTDFERDFQARGIKTLRAAYGVRSY
jgi:tRNA (guanine-N7-)-methyltransferase